VAGVNPLLAGLAGRCPNCGEGPLFRGFLTVADRCDACGYDLGRADSGDGPAVFVILVVFLPLTVVVCGGLLRPMKGILLAAQFANRAAEARHDD
jgi:uncharacterized protein (DUF983 family)